MDVVLVVGKRSSLRYVGKRHSLLLKFEQINTIVLSLIIITYIQNFGKILEVKPKPQFGDM